MADLTLVEIPLQLWEQQQVEISLSRLWTILKEMKLTLKKSHSTPPNRILKQAAAARIDWLAETSQLDPAQLIFLGESGVTTEMTKRYSRAGRGERVGEGVPCGHWRTLTVPGAIGASRWVATMSLATFRCKIGRFGEKAVIANRLREELARAFYGLCQRSRSGQSIPDAHQVVGDQPKPT